MTTTKPKGDEYGRSLKGLGLNLLVTKMQPHIDFLTNTLDLSVTYHDEDFAIVAHQGQEFMLHSDRTYHDNPLLGLTGDGAIRGAGIELRLYGLDPDRAASRAEKHGGHILQAPELKGHGLKEAYIVGPDGYVWVPSLSDEKLS